MKITVVNQTPQTFLVAITGHNPWNAVVTATYYGWIRRHQSVANFKKTLI